MPDRSKIGKKDQAKQTREVMASSAKLPDEVTIVRVENGWTVNVDFTSEEDGWNNPTYVFTDVVGMLSTISALYGVEVRDGQDG